jgi:ferrous iron transport protein A
VRTLDQVRAGDKVTIQAVNADPALMQRLLEMGLMEGESVEVLTIAPLGDPIEIVVGNTRLSLRRREAAAIAVT